jgi:hypothetical protein
MSKYAAFHQTYQRRVRKLVSNVEVSSNGADEKTLFSFVIPSFIDKIDLFEKAVLINKWVNESVDLPANIVSRIKLWMLTKINGNREVEKVEKEY